MNDLKIKGQHGYAAAFKRTPAGTFAEVVAAFLVDPDGNPVANSAAREVLLTRYMVKLDFVGAAVGDVVVKTTVLDVSNGTVDVVAVSWENESSGSAIAAPPSVPVHLEPVRQGDSLTQAQLMSAGLATAANQVTQIGYLADLADANDRHATYKLVQSEDLGAGTKYILKSNGSGWLMIRKTYTETASTLAYAGPASNPGVTLAQAWGQRATLVYSATIGGA